MSLTTFLINQKFVSIEHDSPTNFHQLCLSDLGAKSILPTDAVCILVFWFLFIITNTNTYKHEVLYFCCCSSSSYHHIQTHKTHMNIKFELFGFLTHLQL